MSGKLDECCDLIAQGVSRRDAMLRTGVRWETQLSRHIRFNRPELRGQRGRPPTLDDPLVSLIERRIEQLQTKRSSLATELESLDREIAQCEGAIKSLQPAGELT